MISPFSALVNMFNRAASAVGFLPSKPSPSLPQKQPLTTQPKPFSGENPLRAPSPTSPSNTAPASKLDEKPKGSDVQSLIRGFSPTQKAATKMGLRRLSQTSTDSTKYDSATIADDDRETIIDDESDPISYDTPSPELGRESPLSVAPASPTSPILAPQPRRPLSTSSSATIGDDVFTGENPFHHSASSATLSTRVLTKPAAERNTDAANNLGLYRQPIALPRSTNFNTARAAFKSAAAGGLRSPSSLTTTSPRVANPLPTDKSQIPSEPLAEAPKKGRSLRAIQSVIDLQRGVENFADKIESAPLLSVRDRLRMLQEPKPPEASIIGDPSKAAGLRSRLTAPQATPEATRAFRTFANPRGDDSNTTSSKQAPLFDGTNNHTPGITERDGTPSANMGNQPDVTMPDYAEKEPKPPFIPDKLPTKKVEEDLIPPPPPPPPPVTEPVLPPPPPPVIEDDTPTPPPPPEHSQSIFSPKPLSLSLVSEREPISAEQPLGAVVTRLVAIPPKQPDPILPKKLVLPLGLEEELTGVIKKMHTSITLPKLAPVVKKDDVAITPPTESTPRPKIEILDEADGAGITILKPSEPPLPPPPPVEDEKKGRDKKKSGIPPVTPPPPPVIKKRGEPEIGAGITPVTPQKRATTEELQGGFGNYIRDFRSYSGRKDYAVSVSPKYIRSVENPEDPYRKIKLEVANEDGSMSYNVKTENISGVERRALSRLSAASNGGITIEDGDKPGEMTMTIKAGTTLSAIVNSANKALGQELESKIAETKEPGRKRSEFEAKLAALPSAKNEIKAGESRAVGASFSANIAAAMTGNARGFSANADRNNGSAAKESRSSRVTGNSTAATTSRGEDGPLASKYGRRATQTSSTSGRGGGGR